MTDVPDNKPQSDEFIVHWAQWWAITEQLFLGLPIGTAERKWANTQHEQAKRNLRDSLGYSEGNHG